MGEDSRGALHLTTITDCPPEKAMGRNELPPIVHRQLPKGVFRKYGSRVE